LSLLSIFILLPGSAWADKAVLLKTKWAEGLTYQHRNTMATVVTMKLPNMPEPIEMKMDITMEMGNIVIDELDDAGHIVETSVTRITMDVKGPVSMTYDSSDSAEAQNPLASPMGKMIGKKIRMTLDRDNKLVDIEGLEELTEAMGGEKAGAQTQQMMQGLSPDSMKQMFENSNLSFPDHPVRVGDSWPFVQKINMSGMEVVTELTYTLSGWERKKGRKCAVLTFVGLGKIDMSRMPNTPTGMKMEIKKSEIKGTVWFDIKRGQMVQMDNSMKMTMDMTMVAGDTPGGQGQSFDMNLDMEMEGVFELLKVRKTKKNKR